MQLHRLIEEQKSTRKTYFDLLLVATCDLLAYVSLSFAPATRIFLEFSSFDWFTELSVLILCDWPDWLLWFYFHYILLKIALHPTKLL